MALSARAAKRRHSQPRGLAGSSPAAGARLPPDFYAKTTVRVYRNHRYDGMLSDTYVQDPTLGNKWVTDMEDKWVEFPLGVPDQHWTSDKFDSFLQKITDYHKYHIHVVLPRPFRVEPDVEPPAGWRWADSASPRPTPPVDDHHVLTVEMSFRGGRDCVSILQLMDQEGTGGGHTPSEVRKLVQRSILNVGIVQRRLHTTAVLLENTQLPDALIRTALVPYVFDYRRRQSCHEAHTKGHMERRRRRRRLSLM